MIKIIAQFFIKEQNLEKALWLAQDVAEKTRKESGCIQYEVYQNEDMPTHLIFIEEWEDQNSIDAHGKTMHFLNFIARVNEIKDREAIIERYKKVI